MAKASPAQTNFNRGEVTPLIYGRVDLDQYRAGLSTCKNYVPMVQGGVTARSGTYFVNATKDSAKTSRLIPFEFSVTQAYQIEAGDLYFRFYKDYGVIESSPGVPYEVVTPYAEAHLFELKFTQSADIIYITHPSYAPRKLSRTAHTSWTLTTIDFKDGPYLPTNTSVTTITPSATTGSVTLTASVATFAATDVGRLVRIKHSTTWGYAKITAFTSDVLVTATVVSAFGATTASLDWRLGVWSSTTGYPGCVTFFEDRLFFAGATNYPQRLDGSKSGDYENFAPTDAAGTVAADNGVSFTLNSNDVNVIRWLADDEKGLIAGSVGGEWIIRPSSSGEALSPTNISAKKSTSYGSANVQPVRAGKALVFVQKSGRKVRELAFVYEVDGFRAPDMSVLSEHITQGGVGIQLAYQQEPQSVIWMVRGDGALVGLTYEREQNVVGWHYHELGGTSTVVESISAIPAPDGTRDDLWLIVRRTVDGATKRYVEYMTKFFDESDVLEDAFFVDCGLTYDSVPATSITGLGHLEGETVRILADGAVQPAQEVVSGAITLTRAASKVHVGLGYAPRGKTLRIEAGAADGTAQGNTKRIHNVTFRLHNSSNLRIGPSFDQLSTIAFRTLSDAMGSPPPLFSGDKFETFEGDYETDAYICWEQNLPLPSTVLAVMPQLVTQDR